TTYNFNVSHEAHSVALVGGFDLINVNNDNSGLVVGLTAGKVDSDLHFHNSSTRARMDGTTAGAYLTYAANSFFVDALVNANYMDVEWDAPSVGSPMDQSID